MEIRKLTLDDPTFPAVLREIPSPPEQIYVLGELEPLLARPRLGVVGTRRPTAYGHQVTKQLVKGVVAHDVVVVSGLAFGIDAIAHEATLANGGQTIAVLGSGLHHITPSSNISLAKEILAKGGALISEYAPSTPARRHHFIARNRLIAGLSQTLLVTEATIDSGTRHTALFALDQAKTVMAVPGNIYHPTSEGSNDLIKQYALMVTEYQDILLDLGVTPKKPEQMTLLANSPEEAAVLQHLKTGIKSVEQLLGLTGLEVSTCNVTLVKLELSERIQYLPGGLWGLA